MSSKKVARSQSEWYQQLMFEPDKDAPPEEYDLAEVEPVVKLTVVNTLLRGGGGGGKRGAAAFRLSEGCDRLLAGIVDGAVRHVIQAALQATKKKHKIITTQLLLQAQALTHIPPPTTSPRPTHNLAARSPAEAPLTPRPKKTQKKGDAVPPPAS